MKTIQRKYNETHPWLDFDFATANLRSETWIKLAQTWSRCDQLSTVPLAPAAARAINNRYLVNAIFATAAGDGNTLTQEEVQRYFEHDLKLPPSQDYLGREIDNMIKAHRLIEYRISIGKNPEISPEYIKELNHLVLANITSGAFENPGETRNKSARVGRQRAVPAEDSDFLLHKLCDWLNSRFDEEDGYRRGYGILRAIVARVYLAWIHPFSKGNCRTSGLVEYHLLLSCGLPANAAQLLCIHYAKTRTEYERHLSALTMNTGMIGSFVEYALQGFEDGQKEQIKAIQSEQIDVHWRNHVYDSFRNTKTKTDQRLKLLLLDLSNQNEPVPMSKIRHITPRIAELYAHRSDKTVQRDIVRLKKMDLVKETRSGISANRELAVAFVPTKMQEEGTDGAVMS